MNFEESEKYLYSLGNEVLAMKLGLENIRTVLNALGDPQNNYLKIQIAGTNGKGSTCAFLEAICVAAGINVGATTSPHLVSVTERVRINGKQISEKDFARYATKIREIGEKLIKDGKLENAPTYFEQVTAIALKVFAEASIELAILETGLGGRFDATTAANAEIVGITPIDYDHQNILGNSLAEIAAEKAAIIRRDTKVVVAKQLKEAEKVIAEVCRKLDAKPVRTNFKTEIIEVSPRGTFTVNFQTDKDLYQNIKLSLAGKHQIENAKVAVLLAEILQNYFPITNENIVEGLSHAVHKGRLEFLQGILFDGAHNISGAKAFLNYLDEFISSPITMIFGAMRDKDLTEIAEILFPKAAKLIFTKPDNPRSMKAEELLKYVPQTFDKNKIFQTASVKEAIKLAKEISSENDLIGITGSLYLVGEARKVLQNQTENLKSAV